MSDHSLTLEERFESLDEAKAQFVSKVYFSLTVALGICALCCLWAMKNIALIGPHYIWMSVVSLVIVVISCFSRMAGPIGWGLLGVFTVLTGLCLGPIIHHYVEALPNGGMLVGTSLGLTAGIFLGLTAYVKISGKNFSYLGGFLSMATIGLILFAIASFFIDFGGTLHTIYCGIGALIFCGWILYDTSAVTREYYHDNNVSGAVFMLFYDIVILFKYILMFLTGASRD